MPEKTQGKIQNLELLLHIKSVILKSTSVSFLLENVCKQLTNLRAYEASWAVLVDDDLNATQHYCSIGDFAAKEDCSCWVEAIQASDDMYIRPQNSFKCSGCYLHKYKDASLVSKRLEFEDRIYGVFSVSIENIHLDEYLKKQFSDLVEDVSRAIFLLKTKDRSHQNKLALLESRNMYRKLLETSSVSMGILDIDQNWVFMSNSLKRIFGLNEENIGIVEKGLSLNDSVEPLSLTRLNEGLSDVLKKDHVFTSTTLLKNSIGKHTQMRVKASLIHNGKGESSGFMLVFHDLSDELRSAEALRISEDKFRQVFMKAPNGIAFLDPNGIILDCNEQEAEMLNLKRSDMIGKHIKAFLSDEFRSSFAQNFKDFKSEGVISIVVKMQRKDGSIIDVERNVSAIFSEDGNLKGIIAHSRNVTSELEAQQRIRLLSSAFEQSSSVFTITDLVGNIIYVNKRFEEVSGWSFEEVKGENPNILRAGNMSDASYQDMWNKLRAGEVWKGEIFNERKDGTKYWEYVSMTSIRDDNDEITNILKVAVDVTQRKLTEQKLKDITIRYRNIFNTDPNPIVIHENGTIIDMNRAALIFSKAKNMNTVVGKSILDFIHHSSRKEVLNQFRTMHKGGRTLPFEAKFVNMLGEERSVRTSSSVVSFEGKQSYIVFFEDITNRKKMEYDIIQAKEKAEAGENLKSSFLSNISHEVRTPMNAILGFSDLLRDSKLDLSHRNQYIDVIQQRGNDLLKMISDIMDISKIESGSLEVVHKPVKISQIISESIVLVQNRLSKDSVKKVILIEELSFDENTLVIGDKYRIRQVLNNLLDNAIKFTTKGSISFKCWVDDSFLKFEIEDTGCGIAPEKLSHVFERFVQVYDVKDTHIGGSGLGLSISKSLINLMGGEIEAKSEYGKGSTFSFSFSIYEGVENNFSKDIPPASNSRDWSNKTILIAEDDPSNQLFIRVILGKTNANIIIANDGEDAINLYNENREKIDLVLVDVKMPKVNGYQLTRYLKSQDVTLPVIALTANAMNNDREEALSNGCNDYLTKPISKELLFSTIENYI